MFLVFSLVYITLVIVSVPVIVIASLFVEMGAVFLRALWFVRLMMERRGCQNTGTVMKCAAYSIQKTDIGFNVRLFSESFRFPKLGIDNLVTAAFRLRRSGYGGRYCFALDQRICIRLHRHRRRGKHGGGYLCVADMVQL